MMDAQAKAMLVVTDGLGYSRRRQDEILSDAWDALDTDAKHALLAAAQQGLIQTAVSGIEPAQLARLALGPMAAEMLPEDTPASHAAALLQCLATVRQHAAAALNTARSAIAAAAQKRKYAPWMTDWTAMAQFRNEHLTLPTHAAGKWVGFEDISPPVQGNSETGHIQIGSMNMAPQISLRITNAVKDRSFFDNPAITQCIRHAAEKGRNLNFAFMLSGTCGSDGLVHSNWRHFEAIVEMAFAVHRLPPERVRMLAILDGRDCSARGSVETAADGTGNYLAMARELLEKHGAAESLAWISGRGIAMDRDFQEHNMKMMWRMLVDGRAETADNLDAAVDAVRQQHAAGAGDAAVSPIAIKDSRGNLRTIAAGDAFINVNFRSDRQRAITATLLGDREFLAKESAARQRPWEMDWMNQDLQLHYCCISSYSPEFELMPNVSVAFPKQPVGETLLGICGNQPQPVNYTLAAESVKSLHVGYFIRGCREEPEHPQLEQRHIVPSFDAASGIKSDSDVYLQPEMRTVEIEKCMLDALNGEQRLLICNFAATDMVGHLLPQRLEQAAIAYSSTVHSVLRLAHAALASGWHFIWTSDHGNIEEDSPSHTASNVLTTIAAPQAAPQIAPLETFQARLYDISPTLARILGMEWSQGEGVDAGVPLIR